MPPSRCGHRSPQVQHGPRTGSRWPARSQCRAATFLWWRSGARAR
ncbi:hypothetical protein [Ornithinimicrobium kibberense]